MEWFKHLTSSHEDPDISDSWDKFGPIGPLMFWVILEVYGREFSRLNGTGELTLTWKYFQNKVRTKRKTSENILAFFRERNRIESETFQECVKIKIPKFLEMSSNWVRYHKHIPTQAPTQAPINKRQTEVRSKNKNKEEDIKHIGDVKQFFNLYSELFESQFGNKPMIEFGKDGKLIKSLLRTIPLDELKSLLRTFFDSTDKFILQSGYTIGVFKSQINKLRIGPQAKMAGLKSWADEIKEEEHGKEKTVPLLIGNAGRGIQGGHQQGEGQDLL